MLNSRDADNLCSLIGAMFASQLVNRLVNYNLIMVSASSARRTILWSTGHKFGHKLDQQPSTRTPKKWNFEILTVLDSGKDGTLYFVIFFTQEQKVGK